MAHYYISLPDPYYTINESSRNRTKLFERILLIFLIIFTIACSILIFLFIFLLR